MNHIVRVVAAPSAAATPKRSPARSGAVRRRRDPGASLTLPQPGHTQRWPHLDLAVADRVAEWGPPKKLTPEQQEAWPEAEDGVREWVALSAPETAAAASARMWAASRLGIAAVLEFGTLDPSIVLTEHNIQYVVNTVYGDQPKGWRHSLRIALSCVGRAVNPGGFTIPLPAIGRAEVPKPYAPSDEEYFALDAAMPGRGNVVARMAVTGLALSTGTRGPEIALAGPQDVVTHRGGRVSVLVQGANAREVPVREPYSELVLRAARECRGDRFMTSTDRSAVAAIAGRIKGPDGRGLSLRRARTTWLAAHLVVSTPLAALRRFAGPIGGPMLTALLDHTSAELDAQAALEMGWGA